MSAVLNGMAVYVALGLALLLVIVALVILLGRKEQPSGPEFMAWPTVTGRITFAEVAESESRGTDAFDEDEAPLLSVGVTRYRLAIKYAYTVKGTPHDGWVFYANGTRIPTFSNRDRIERFVRSYPLGSMVTVHYNPRDPSEAAVNLDPYLPS
jgi:hypothetical protein